MTKEEAKLVLDNARPQTKEIDRQFYDDEDLNNALDMAIKALEQQPSEVCVSKESVKELFQEGCVMGMYDFLGIDDLPPVTPTFPKGATNGDVIKAIFPNVYSEECDYDIFTTLDGDTRFTYDWWDAPYERGDSDDSN